MRSYRLAQHDFGNSDYGLLRWLLGSISRLKVEIFPFYNLGHMGPKKGFPKVDSLEFLGDSLNHELPKNFPIPFTQFSSKPVASHPLLEAI